MKKISRKIMSGFAVLAACLTFAFVFTTCGQNLGDTLQSGLADITYTAEANGEESTISTKINFVFSADVRRLGLTAADITIAGGPGAADKHNLTTTDATATRWTLDITVRAGGKAEVSIEKASIEAGKKGVTLHKSLYVVRGIIRTSIGAARGAVVKLMQGGDVKGVARASSSGNYSIGAAAGTGYSVQVSLAGFVIETSAEFDITAADPPAKNVTLQAYLDLENNFPFENPGFWTYTAGKNMDNYNYFGNVYTIESGATVTIAGDAAQSGIPDICVEVAAGPKTSITLDGVTIDMSINSWASGGSALGLSVGAEVELTLADGSNNTLKAGGSGAGVEVPEGSTLTIKGSGSLTAEGSSLVIFYGGAGIGGRSYANSSQKVSASAGTITILGGTIVATGGSPASEHPNRGGAGIGSGGFGSTGGTITISGANTSVTATGGGGVPGLALDEDAGGAAGIGGGLGSASGDITISGGCYVKAVSIGEGAAIGGGGADYWYNAGNSGNISISADVKGELIKKGSTRYHVGPGDATTYRDFYNNDRTEPWYPANGKLVEDGVKNGTISIGAGAFNNQSLDVVP